METFKFFQTRYLLTNRLSSSVANQIAEFSSGYNTHILYVYNIFSRNLAVLFQMLQSDWLRYSISISHFEVALEVWE